MKIIQNISVIGAGTMGNGIAHTLAQNNFNVNLIDNDINALKKALITIKKNLDRQIDKGALLEYDKSHILNQIHIYTELAEGVSEADLVIEAATENLDIKLQIFRDLDNFTSSETILASNTSSISITKIASITKKPEKVIGLHFMNPVPVMKLVEVINGFSTDEKTIKTVLDLVHKIHKTPVISKDYPGFIANRILMPMINEAIYTLHEGVADVKSIDEVMKLGMSHPMGPLQLADFIGLDVCLSILNVLYEGFGNAKYAPCPLLVNMVNSDQKGIKSGCGFYDYTEKSKELKVNIKFR
jgi:3-hydroxybutyryl-CoA dehydrogenase